MNALSPLGKAPTVIAGLALIAGAYLALHPEPSTRGTLRFWTFARNHYQAYVEAAPAFEAAHPGTAVDVQLVHADAVTSRLRAAFWAGLDVPDLAEVVITRAAAFFRGPVEEVGFIDLTAFLDASGYRDRIVQSRFGAYTSRGRIYGLPHDVHPVMLAYRRDLFEEEGIDAAGLTTWEDLVRAGRRITRPGTRYMLELSDGKADELEVFLFQRGGGYFDRGGQLIMDDETAVATLLWYIPLVAGLDRIGTDLGSGRVFTQAIEQGYFASFLCPDWRTKLTEIDVPRMHGKMALMPLPAFEPGGRRTSTRGGTMLGITKATPDKDLAWELAVHMYLDKEELAERFRETNILPPLRDAWTLPAFSEPRAYWSGQPIGQLYAGLADETPPHYSSPFEQTAVDKMGQVVSACSAYYRENGANGFEGFARQRLHAAAEEVRRHMRRNPL